MRMRSAIASVVLVVGCGDNRDDGPGVDAPVEPACAPTPGPLPTIGAFADPLALPLPDNCVTGGLRDLPGRWFVVDPAEVFTFDYPKFEGNCEIGFRRSFTPEEDTDESDAQSFFSWSDGTRIYNRFSIQFPQDPDPPFEFTNAFAACMLPDGTLAGV